jgi:hypothetical protein
MQGGADANELRLNWSARGLAYLLSKLGIEGPIPTTSREDGTARVELRVLGTEVKDVRWTRDTRVRANAMGTRDG